MSIPHVSQSRYFIPVFAQSRNPGILVPKLHSSEFVEKSMEFYKYNIFHLYFFKITLKILKCVRKKLMLYSTLVILVTVDTNWVTSTKICLKSGLSVNPRIHTTIFCPTSPLLRLCTVFFVLFKVDLGSLPPLLRRKVSKHNDNLDEIKKDMKSVIIKS
jgi:hypothetical protein